MKRRLEVTISQKSPAVILSGVLMLLSAGVRLGYYLPRQNDGFTLWVLLWMPVAAAALYLAGLLLGGSRAKAGAIAATAVGVTFFILKALRFTPIHRNLCILLYCTVLCLFTATLLGLLPTKKLLYPLFGLPFLYHLLVEDPPAYLFSGLPVREWMPEISVLCIMAALFSLSVGLRTRKIERN